jgi:hypothetical protein
LFLARMCVAEGRSGRGRAGRAFAALEYRGSAIGLLWLSEPFRGARDFKTMGGFCDGWLSGGDVEDGPGWSPSFLMRWSGGATAVLLGR